MSKMHTEKRPHELCTICGEKYTRPAGLRLHIESVHEGKKPHACTFCEATFAEKGGLRRHIRTVHEDKR